MRDMDTGDGIKGPPGEEHWIEAELRAKRKEQEEERKYRHYLAAQRTIRLGYFATAIGIGLVIGVVVLGIAWMIQGNAKREHEERIACNEAGGTYITSGLEDKLCLVGVEER